MKVNTFIIHVGVAFIEVDSRKLINDSKWYILLCNDYSQLRIWFPQAHPFKKIDSRVSKGVMDCLLHALVHKCFLTDQVLSTIERNCKMKHWQLLQNIVVSDFSKEEQEKRNNKLDALFFLGEFKDVINNTHNINK